MVVYLKLTTKDLTVHLIVLHHRLSIPSEVHFFSELRFQLNQLQRNTHHYAPQPK